MTDLAQDSTDDGGSTAVVALPSAADLQAWIGQLGGAGGVRSDAERIDLLHSLEVLKCAAEGAQAELTADFDASQRSEAARVGVRAERQGRGVAAQVALARRESPFRGRMHVGLATVLRREMPYTWAAFRAGRISEYRAMLLLRETACLELPHRQRIDRDIAGDLDRVEGMGDGELIGAARRLAYRLEPRSFTERRRKAEAERHTRLRAAPDTMSIFTALLSVKNGVSMQAVLGREADRLRDAGDPRTRGQLMADLLVERVVNPFVYEQTGTGSPSSLPIMVNVTVPDCVLFGDDDGGGHVDGYGPVPGDLLREWIADAAEAEDVTVWLRRVYEKPETGALVAMDSTARRFTGKLAEFLRIRDRGCRTPYCDAPVRHLDHATAYADGGPTSARNAQGLCESCNYAKQVQGWIARARNGPPDEAHTIDTVTPTGHTYSSTAERLGGARPRRADFVFPVTIAA